MNLIPKTLKVILTISYKNFEEIDNRHFSSLFANKLHRDNTSLFDLQQTLAEWKLHI